MNTKTIWVIFGVVFVAIVAGYLFLLKTPSGVPEKGGGETDTPTAETPVTQEKMSVNVFLIDLESKSGKGKAVGCGDAVVPSSVEIPQTQAVLRAALERLLAVKDMNVGSGYNALYQSDLKIESVSVESVRLSGELRSGGVCDDPRIVAQITETVRQFPTTKNTKIFINNIPLEEYFSGR